MASSSNHLFSSLTRFCFWSCQYQHRSKPNSNTLMLKPPLLAPVCLPNSPLYIVLFILSGTPVHWFLFFLQLTPLFPGSLSSLFSTPVSTLMSLPPSYTLPFLECSQCLFPPACQDEPSSLPRPHSPEAEGHESHDRGESLFYTVTFTNHTAHISGNTCTSAQLTFLLSTTTSLKVLHFPQTAKTHPNPLSADDLVSLHKKTLSH